jgi:hypothetical protein
MGYHKRKIEKGTYGKFSKIKEEFQELEDAVEQDIKILKLVELSDLIGAIEGYAESMGLSLDELKKFNKLTKSAFKDGTRKSK